MRDSGTGPGRKNAQTGVVIPLADSSLLAVMVPANAGEFWTCALTVATAALAVVAFLGLRSVALSKKDILNRARRESAQCAVDKCNEMRRELMPLYTEIIADLAEKAVPVFVAEASQVSFEEREEIRKIASAVEWVRLSGV